MATASLKDRIQNNTLPLVLAGPLVRRVTTESASVWLVTRDACQVTLEVFERGSQTPIATGQRDTEPIGAHLHIVVVTARHPFDAGRAYRYNVKLTTSGVVRDLFTPGVILGLGHGAHEVQDLLSYEGAEGPSFLVPPATLAELRIIHGSCRKIAGDGADAFGAIDVMLANHFASPGSVLRPAMLLLTGDNIYTDGSDREVLEVLTEASTALMGFDEVLPGLDKKLSELPSRAPETIDDAGMTGARPFRTFGLGETIALHLMTFADVIWPEDAGFDSRGFRASMQLSTRRILANIATYMTFDDHEVGNSWNICFDWIYSVWSRPLGRRVYQNCLAAFALCQAWGNTPDQFEDGPSGEPGSERPGSEFLTAIVAWSAQHGPAPEQFPLQRALEARLGIPALTGHHPLSDFADRRRLALLHRADSVDDPELLSEPQIRWDFTVLAGEAQITVLDVHTWSEYGDDKFEPVRRMPAEAWDRQLVAQAVVPRVAIVVVSNIAILSPRAWSKALDVVAHGLRPDDRDELWDKLAVGLGVGLVAGVSVALLLELAEATLSRCTLIVILVGLLAVIVALLIFYGIKDRAYLRLVFAIHAVLRSSRNVYTDEVGYNFEWGSTPFERLIARLASHYMPAQGPDPARIVVLSGDVHSSYTMRLEYWATRPFEAPQPRPVTAVFAQLVGSPVKYVSSKPEYYEDLTRRYFAGWRESKPGLGPGTDEHNLFWNRGPWLAPFHPTGPSPRFTTAEDWAYAIQAITPVRLTELRRLFGKPQSLADYVATLDDARKVAIESLRNSTKLRTNNVAEVTFDWTHQPTVRHRVWWWWESAGETPATPQWIQTDYVVDMVAGARPVVP